MKSLTFSTLSSVKTALKTSLTLRFSLKIKVIFGLSTIFGEYFAHNYSQF